MTAKKIHQKFVVEMDVSVRPGNNARETAEVLNDIEKWIKDCLRELNPVPVYRENPKTGEPYENFAFVKFKLRKVSE